MTYQKKTSPRILLINPWIYDFAAFDMWAKPMGLLYISAALKKAGLQVSLIDCLEREQKNSTGKDKFPGLGHWKRKIVPTPEPLAGIPRRFARYGISEEAFLEKLENSPKPDLVMVTSIMTYWYPGVHLAIKHIKDIWPGVPVVLGGIYATLATAHAEKYSGADFVLTGRAENSLPVFFKELFSHFNLDEPALKILSEEPVNNHLPDLKLYQEPEFAPLMTSRGCPFSCPYCASNQLFPKFIQRPVKSILAEIKDRVDGLGITDFVFYDDALLEGSSHRFTSFLEGIIENGIKIRFHAPNGLHLKLIDRETGSLMYRAGFRTLRLGLETLDIEQHESWGGKVGQGEFEKAVSNLAQAGFDHSQIGVYLLYGLPGQTLRETEETIRLVKKLGVRPYLAEFSPLPGTPMMDKALAHSSFDLEGEPLFQNNTFFPVRPTDFSWEKVWEMKRMALAD